MEYYLRNKTDKAYHEVGKVHTSPTKITIKSFLNFWSVVCGIPCTPNLLMFNHLFTIFHIVILF